MYRRFQKQIGKSFLQREIVQNPEFDKAFPNLAKYKNPTTVQQESKEQDFFESLKHNSRNQNTLTYDQSLIYNQKSFVEGYLSPKGPFQYISQKELDRIHLQADQKLQDLENTGLSREELLFDKDLIKGIPLKQDPFFQLIKSSRIAREVLFKKGEEFNVQRIVDLALRQEIGQDPNISKYNDKKYQHGEQLEDDIKQINKNLALKTNPTDQQLQERLTSAVLYHKMPEKASLRRKKNTRKVNWFDIHWRNTELLVDFLNPAGMIKGRYQTRLKGNQQHEIAKAIKNSRHMCIFYNKKVLLPFAGFVKASDKKSLRTLQEDIDDYTRNIINLENGQLCQKSEIQKFYNFSTDYERYEEYLKLFGEISPIDFNKIDNETMKLIKAKIYANVLKEKQLEQQGVDIQELKNDEQNHYMDQHPINDILNQQAKDNFENMKKEQFKPFYEKIAKEIKNYSAFDIGDLFISEKANDYKYMKETVQQKIKIDKDINILQQELLKLKQELKIDQ